MEALVALDRKLRFVREDGVARGSLARRDVEGALEKLRVKAVTKVRRGGRRGGGGLRQT